MGNSLGRRKTIFLGTCIMIVGAILQCSSYELAQFIVGRIITGMGNGLNTSTVPTWQSECSRSHRRGQLVMIEGALITGGIMIAYWVQSLHQAISYPSNFSTARLRFLLPRPQRHLLAFPIGIPNGFLRPHPRLCPQYARESAMVDSQGSRGRRHARPWCSFRR